MPPEHYAGPISLMLLFAYVLLRLLFGTHPVITQIGFDRRRMRAPSVWRAVAAMALCALLLIVLQVGHVLTQTALPHPLIISIVAVEFMLLSTTLPTMGVVLSARLCAQVHQIHQAQGA